jgi:histidinol-phosphatase (PHP family)
MPFTNQMMKNNYHTHIYLCRHASGHVKDYVKEAIQLGFTSLGMSDHAPFEKLIDRSVRMYPEELPMYFQELEEAIELYQGKIQIHRGLEIEYFHDQFAYYQELLSKLDYLALGQHYIQDSSSRDGLRSSYTLSRPEHLLRYASEVEEAIQTNFFSFVCHPDLMLYGYPSFDEVAKVVSLRIIDAAMKADIPLEINANGIRKGMRTLPEGIRYLYPRKEFWELVKERKARVIISSDAHHVEHLMDEAVIQAYEFAQEIGIEVEEAITFQTKHRS